MSGFPQELCARCGHVKGLHDNGDGPCLAYHRGALDMPPCECPAFVPHKGDAARGI